MGDNMLEKANIKIKDMESKINNNELMSTNKRLKVGVDLGTSNIVLVVLDEEDIPVCGEMYEANVVRDGIVVDYLKAVDIVTLLKNKLEKKLNTSLEYAATAMPPGISSGNIKVIRNVVENAGFTVTNVVDEPTAASRVLEIENGAVVDIGGGTTGISILKNGSVVYSADEPTGGTHLSLVLAGNYNISFEEADKLKRESENYNRVFPVITPVLEKMGNIILSHVSRYNVDQVYLVGGTCCLKGMESVIQKYININTIKPYNPLLVTPIGIAMSAEL